MKNSKPLTEYSNRVQHPVTGDLSRWYVEVGYLATGIWYGGRADIHPGWDYNLRTGGNSDAGQDIVAIADGEVIFAGVLPYWGGVVIVRHPQFGVRSRYGHISPTVKVGQFVKAGDKLGDLALMAAWPSHLHLDITTKTLSAGHWCGRNRDCVLRTYVDLEQFFLKHGVALPRETGGKRLSWVTDDA